jgi:putative protease
MQDLGISDCSLSLEDDRGNVEKLLTKNRQERLILTIFSPVELFSSRVPAPAQSKKVTLVNDRGEQLFLEESHGLTITSARKPFSLMGRVQQLRKMGCRKFSIDLRGVGFLTGDGQEILRAFYEDRILPETTLFNFERGLS